MRNHKNNIIFNVRNITLILKNITPYFTGKIKIITLVFIIIMLSFTNIINTSALSYSSSVGVGFTFNPTLSVSLSSSDLVISNLIPGNTLDSNVINISVASNASYGYTLSAIVNGNNNDLTHTNDTNTFSSIATDADLSSLDNSEDTNIWGYSYKDNTVQMPAWSNYSGLSSSNSATLLDTNTNNTETGIDSIDFKIAAKASNTQPSGTYTGTINFAAVTKPIPVTLAEAYASEGKTMTNGFYTMQDMTSTICNKVEAIGAQLQVLDERDSKLYWIAKLADNHCWMTQNLDLDLDSNRTYTHWDTDLGWSTDSGNTIDENATWQPIRSTIDFTIGSTISGWQSSTTEPYSANPGDVYFYTSNSDADDAQYSSLQDCTAVGHNDCAHYHAGNYYNWSAAVASNESSDISNAPNSTCPSKWRLPSNTNNEFGNLLVSSNIIDSNNSRQYLENGFRAIRKTPLWFVRSNTIYGTSVDGNTGKYGAYWSSTNYNGTGAWSLLFESNIIYPKYNIMDHKYIGRSARCLAR